MTLTRQSTASAASVHFSVIIPTFNRPRSLQSCLDALAALDYPTTRYEVIVVDDGGALPLDELVGGFADRLQITLIRQTNSGPGAARNEGVRRARGSFVAFIDDDCAAEPGWLRELERRFSAQPECAVAGCTVNGLTEDIYATASQMLVHYLFDYYCRNSRRLAFGTSSNLAFPRAALIGIGGFDRSFGLAAEDRELCDRWNFAGNTLVYADEVRVLHFRQMNFWSFLRQHRSYGQGAFQYHRVRARRTAEPIRVEPLGFYLGMLSYPYSRSPLPQALCISSLLVLSQFMGAVGFFQQRRSKRMQPD